MNYMKTLEYARANPDDMQMLDEATINTILSKHSEAGYCIVSACRGRIKKDGSDVLGDEKVSEDELLHGQELEAENNRRTIRLKEMIIKGNHSFLPVYGGYKEDGNETPVFEKSFVIFDFDRKGNISLFDDVLADCIDYGNTFVQDSILVKEPNKAPYYLSLPEKSISMVFSDDIAEYKFNDITQMYFTALKKLPAQKERDNSFVGSPQRFTFESCYINPKPVSHSERVNRHFQGELF